MKSQEFASRYVLSRTIRLAALCLLALTVTPVMADNILLVLSEGSPAYQAFARGFRASNDKHGQAVEVTILESSQLGAAPLPETDMVVAVGSRAAEALAARNFPQPLLMAMLPRNNLERLTTQRPKSGGVYIDQPASRYVALIRAALPDFDRIGLLSGRDSKDTVARLRAAASSQKLRAHAEAINDEADIYPAMQRLFADGGALLATPDTTVFNAQTLPSILLSAFRRNVPVVGFSPSYVSAGAVVALYSTPEQLAAQSAEICFHVLAGAPVPAPQPPRHYTISVNERVARSLGLVLEGENLIRERLERLERQP